MKTIDLKGKKYNSLTVIEKAETRILPSGQHKTMWKCKCDCGRTTIVASYALRNNGIRSCKVCGKEKSANSRKTHGMSYTRLHNIWTGMKSRCYNPNHMHYKNYGGRGIVVCEEWKSNFQSFHDWAVSNGYSEELTIDRIDNNGNYEPSNCQWCTKKEQANNTRRNKRITYNGQTKTLAQWAEEFKISQDLLGERLLRNIPFQEAVKHEL